MTPKQQALEELMAVMEKHGIRIHTDICGGIRIESSHSSLIATDTMVDIDDIKTELNRMKGDG